MEQSNDATASDARAKTVGAPVPPALYQRLMRIKTEHKLSSIKAALLLAAEHGCDALLHEKKAEAPPLTPTTW